MALYFFTVSFQDEVMTLSAVAFHLYYLSKSSSFDAKPAIFEAMTLSPSVLFFV